MALPVDFIERLKAANPIDEVMGTYVSLRRSGRDYVCLCPFHNEKTPSCYIHPDRDYFHCFGCGAGGDVITFTMKYNNLDYWEAVKLLAERGGVPLPQDSFFQDNKGTDIRKRIYEMNKTAARFFYDKLRSPEGRQCLDYLINKRKLKPETIKHFGMGFAPNSWSELKSHMLSEGYTEEELIKGSLISTSRNNSRNTFDFFVNRAMFPFFDLSGHIVGFGGRALDPEDKRKYLNSKQTPVYDKERYLFSMNFAKNVSIKEGSILLCEGNLDVISLHQAGFENAVASCGTALTAKQVKIISQYAESVVICYDSDEAGQKATQKAIRLISETGLRTSVIKMDGAKDPDEYINKFGEDHFRRLIKGSEDAVSFRLSKCREGKDLDSAAGKYEYIRDACKVLAELSSPAQREVYIAELEKQTEINKDVIKSELSSYMRRQDRVEKKKEWNRTATFTNYDRSTGSPAETRYRKEIRAEEGLICYLYNNPDMSAGIAERLAPEKFITDLERRLYKSLTDKIAADEDHSVSSFNDEFSPDEVGKLTAMLDKYRQLDITPQVAEDYVNVLLAHSEDSGGTDYSADGDNSDFLRKLNELKMKNKK